MDSCELMRKETKVEVVHLNQKQLAARGGERGFESVGTVLSRRQDSAPRSLTGARR